MVLWVQLEKVTKEHKEENRGAKRICVVLKLVLKGSPFILQCLLFRDWLNTVDFSECDMYRTRLFF